MNEQTTATTEQVEPSNKKTSRRIKTGAALLLGVAVLGLVIDDQVRKFKGNKTTPEVVEETPEN